MSDRYSERLEIDRQIEALMRRRSELSGQDPEDCPGEGTCHGSLGWCNICGDVNRVCDMVGCDTHFPKDESGDRPQTPDRYHGQS